MDQISWNIIFCPVLNTVFCMILNVRELWDQAGSWELRMREASRGETCQVPQYLIKREGLGQGLWTSCLMVRQDFPDKMNPSLGGKSVPMGQGQDQNQDSNIAPAMAQSACIEILLPHEDGKEPDRIVSSPSHPALLNHLIMAVQLHCIQPWAETYRHLGNMVFSMAETGILLLALSSFRKRVKLNVNTFLC